MLRKSLAVFFAVAVAATANSAVQLQRGKPDGYKTVAHAQWLGSSGKLEEGRAFIAELRARPLEGRTVEEIQAVDMAEFALLRSNIKTEKKRCRTGRITARPHGTDARGRALSCAMRKDSRSTIRR